MNACPKCGTEKANDHKGAPVVCWGECWRGEGGLKYTNLDIEEWLKENTTLGNK